MYELIGLGSLLKAESRIYVFCSCVKILTFKRLVLIFSNELSIECIRWCVNHFYERSLETSPFL
jgi:hypothetical protein